MILKERIRNLKSTVLSNQWYTLKKVTYQYLKRDQEWQSQTREVYDRGHGAAILLYNLDKRTVILIRQLRIPTYIEGHETGMQIEVCAGLLEDHDPEVCIKKEVLEETGYEVQNVKKVYEAYMSPGAVTEKIYFFTATYTEDMKINDGGGLTTEHEDIEVLEVSSQQAIQWMQDGTILDAKTIMLLQYGQIHGLL